MSEVINQSQDPLSKRGMFDQVPPKFTFVFGLVIGIAAFSLFGYISLLARVSSNGTKSATNTNSKTTGLVAGDSNTNVNTNAAPLSPVKAVTDEDYYRGNKDAQVILVEYSDLQCPYCQNFQSTAKQIMDKYGDQVKWVYRHFPLSGHPDAQKLAEGAECAAEQGGNEAFWKYADKVFEEGTVTSGIPAVAKAIGLNEAAMKTCLDSGKYESAVTQEFNDGAASGVTGTPSTFIVSADGTTISKIPGALPFAQVEPMIKNALGI